MRSKKEPDSGERAETAVKVGSGFISALQGCPACQHAMQERYHKQRRIVRL